MSIEFKDTSDAWAQMVMDELEASGIEATKKQKDEMIKSWKAIKKADYDFIIAQLKVLTTVEVTGVTAGENTAPGTGSSESE